MLPRDDCSTKSYMWLINAYTASKKPLGKMCDAHAAMLPKPVIAIGDTSPAAEGVAIGDTSPPPSETLPQNNGADADGSEVVSLSTEPAEASSEKKAVTAEEDRLLAIMDASLEKDPDPAKASVEKAADEKASENAAAKASDEKTAVKASAKSVGRPPKTKATEEAGASLAKRPKGAKP